jgi:phosphopantetheinyl transferase (holo-ACP synthase)
MEWDMVKEEVMKAVSTYVKDVTLNNISVIRDDSNDNSIYMKLEYTVNKGNDKENKILAVRL